MKIKLLFSAFLISLATIISCKKESTTTKNNNPVIPKVKKAPVLTTSAITSIIDTTAVSGGSISDSGSSAIIERGICWNTTGHPTIFDKRTQSGTGMGNFTITMTNLISLKTYYVRAYAGNSDTVGYGNEVSFTTLVVDIDGNIYHAVTIGTQTWLVENLKTSRYNDGGTITTDLDSISWGNTFFGAYAYYNNDPSTNATYGKLYNWDAVYTGKLAPKGWHVPSFDEMTTLTDYLGGNFGSGGAMKETGTLHWQTPNTGATNVSGFTALPGGERDLDGSYSGFGTNNYYWTTRGLPGAGWALSLDYSTANTSLNYYYDNYGFSIRCLKN
ncbi:MAG: hypothetical protein JWN78_2515 [Bacteroidota bacterium]|nr:hypothetical protein [Bacteroidota bacterium]